MGFLANSVTVAADQQLKFLIYDKTVLIGGFLDKICQAQSISFEYDSGGLKNRSSLEADNVAVKPTHVFTAGADPAHSGG